MARRNPFVLFLMATVVLCGAFVMVVEVVGARMIAPFFGVSLFVWTSLIAVTLIALAAGYAVGGWAADRWPGADALYGVILAAGLLVMAVPFLRVPVLTLCQPLGLRAGAFASTLILFGPALFLLGWVSPYTVRIAVAEMDRLGRTVGGFYALSTMGSVAGTLLTGFVLIGTLGLNGIFTVTGALLVALAGLYFALFRRRRAALVLLLAGLVPLQPPPTLSRTLSDGTVMTELESVDSFYGNIRVLEFAFGPTRTRELLIDGLTQGGVDPATGESIYEYQYFLQYLPRALHPTGRRALVIGVGAGIVPGWYSRQGVLTDVVDIDPVVVEMARRHFGFTTSGKVVLQDARYALTMLEPGYDYVVVDVANADFAPPHVISLEAFRLVAEKLAPEGVLAINFPGSTRGEVMGPASLIRTLRQVFDTVQLFPNHPPEEAFGNMTVIAYHGERRPLDRHALARQPVHPMAARAMGLLGREATLPADAPAVVLTDDFNPLDFADAHMRETIRNGSVHGTDWQVLLVTR